ncbi:hypothetical protein GW756_03885 [bacterium]|nr:hypothetical protein [bacterium]NCQ55258.1 hypothetical protein [Candidatus Parcubacteria bacterium]NCS67229.1 hypothetical protein [Candidatus Peregrinibacteria bacterium]NCS96484.1 hypothetical protein [bacterium]
MSTQIPNTPAPAPNVTPPPTAKEPVFNDPNDNIKPEEKESKFHHVSEQAQTKLHNMEDSFISLSSQRQLNFILGSLIIIAALTAAFGMLISILLGTLMIVQAVTGNMLLNDFFDKMDQKQKRWLIPALIGVVAFIFIAYIIIGFVGVGEN